MSNMNEERLSRDQYFMLIAKITSQRSTCIREKNGAILVKDNRIIATGYNGSPKGCKNCCEVGCRKTQLGIKVHGSYFACRSSHAEENAIIHSALNSCSPENSVIYTTRFPCSSCLKTLINAGIKEIIYMEPAPKPETGDVGEELLKSSKMKTRMVKV